ncbi:hypothetical protein [Aphanizomenon sp. CS-733/32]|uniref:hypothetical protein n=1 Tax=Aphanizomenon sp. CS-733/32 TaxID=3021715 RepID=UPI00232ADCAF|nr:hypothetical protein [Aphanizomenon sp. CS-733/32]
MAAPHQNRLDNYSTVSNTTYIIGVRSLRDFDFYSNFRHCIMMVSGWLQLNIRCGMAILPVSWLEACSTI